MTRFATNLFAAVAAIMIAATSFTAITTVPMDTPVATTASPVLA